MENYNAQISEEENKYEELLIEITIKCKDEEYRVKILPSDLYDLVGKEYYESVNTNKNIKKKNLYLNWMINTNQ